MVHQIHGMLWGPVMLFVMLAVGGAYTIRSGFFQIRRPGLWLKATIGSLWKEEKEQSEPKDHHSVTRWQSACTALAATVGTGNIAGVATALTAGGPGAVFWMWISAGIGMMTAYAETSLGIRYRYRDEKGRWICGPMVCLERGLNLPKTGVLYGIFCILASFGMGSMVQSNAIADTVHYAAGWNQEAVGAVLLVLVLFVIRGGISRIAVVSEKLIPLSAGAYVFFALIVLGSYYDRIPAVMGEIFRCALTPEAAVGGVGGYGISRSIRYGVARGVFSNEAGLGSLAVLHGATEDTTPEEQGMWAMFEVFFDTIVICTLTALVILCGTWQMNAGQMGSGQALTGQMGGGWAAVTGYDGAALTAYAFRLRLGGAGQYLVSAAMLLFAFATIIAWYYLARQTLTYLLEKLEKTWPKTRKIRGILEFTYLAGYLAAVFLGCISSLDLVWEISDIWNGLMAVPNLIALICLMRQVTFPKSA